MSKPPDTPQFNISPNASRPGLVSVCIGSGMGGYNITPECAEEIAGELVDASQTARDSVGPTT